MTFLHTAMLQSPKSIHNPRFTVSKAEYWEKYYGNTDVIYEWNNGLLEEKPVSDHVNYLMFSWFVGILQQFLTVHPIAETTGLEFGFRLGLPNQTAIRRPDLGVILNDNPVALYPRDCTYDGVCDMCIEALSDSAKKDEERDTVYKKAEYAASGVKEYYILHDSRKIAFYRLNATGIYVPIKPVGKGKGVIKSKVLPGFQFRITDLYQRPSLKTMSEDKVYQGFILPFYQEEKRARLKAEQRADAVQAKNKLLEAELARLKKK